MTRKIIRLSMKAIFNNKMRSFLTMLGIIIGVMAVVILVSITQGASRGITSSISDMGSDRITATITDEDVSVSAEEVEALAKYSSIESVAPTISVSGSVRKKSGSGNFSVLGVTSSYFDVMNEDIQRGRLILDSDNEWHTDVCVIGTKVATELFDTWDAVGGTINVGDKVYKVVGVLEEQGSSLVGSDDSKVLIPYTTAARVNGSASVTSFYINASSTEDVSAAMNIVEAYLLSAMRDEDAYSVNNQSDILDTMDDVKNTLSLLLAGIAAISLIVGGIGIMNIMLVSVTERTKEIGIRKAVGAKRRHIMTQFLCESCVLSVFGGLIGFLLSLLGINIYNAAAGSEIVMNWSIAAAAIAFCAVIGVLFGSYPAAKASKLRPIEALRAE